LNPSCSNTVQLGTVQTCMEYGLTLQKQRSELHSKIEVKVLSQGTLQMWVTPLQLTLYNGVMFTLHRSLHILVKITLCNRGIGTSHSNATRAQEFH